MKISLIFISVVTKISGKQNQSILMELSSVIEGKCPKCGKQYFGWSLQNPRNQSCANCGSGLIILEDGRLPVRGYSPFTAPEYKLKSTYLDYHKQEKES